MRTRLFSLDYSRWPFVAGNVLMLSTNLLSHCGFCSKDRNQVGLLIVSQRAEVGICDECVIEVMRILAEDQNTPDLWLPFWGFAAIAELGYKIARLFSNASYDRTPMELQHTEASEFARRSSECDFCERNQAEEVTRVAGTNSSICSRCATKVNGKPLLRRR
jgi:ClpX C4-type zinc finger